MRGRARGRKLTAVSVQPPVRVVLEIVRTSRTISGKLAIDGASTCCFYGWLELLDALERVADIGIDRRQAVDGGEQTCEA